MRLVGKVACFSFWGPFSSNLNTYDAMIPSLNWFQQDLLIWIPNMVGSILFLISGYLAFIENCHAYFAWHPSRPSWWVVSINLVGCICFMVSALLAVVLPFPTDSAFFTSSVILTLLGAVAFLAGSLLMMVEANLGRGK